MRIGEAVAILVGVLCCHWAWPAAKPMLMERTPGYAVDLRQTLDATHPRLVLAGSPSDLDALDASFLEEEAALVLPSARLASAWWYLILKNALTNIDTPPATFAVFYSGVDPTLPEKRVFAPADRRALDALATDRERLLDRLAYHERMDPVAFTASAWTGLYQARMPVRNRLESAVGEVVANLVGVPQGELQNARQERFSQPHWDPTLREQHQEERIAARTAFDNRYFDFPTELRTSFLPGMADLARRHGIRLVFVETAHALRYTPEQEVLAERYRHAFRTWLDWQGGVHLDLRDVPPAMWSTSLRTLLNAKSDHPPSP